MSSKLSIPRTRTFYQCIQSYLNLFTNIESSLPMTFSPHVGQVKKLNSFLFVLYCE